MARQRQGPFRKSMKLGVHILLWSAFASLSFLETANQYSFRFLTQGLKISSDVNIPPYSALEDQNLILDDETLDESSAVEPELLIPGKDQNRIPIFLAEDSPKSEKGNEAVVLRPLSGIIVSQREEETASLVEEIDVAKLDRAIEDSNGELFDIHSRKQIIASYFSNVDKKNYSSLGSIVKKATELVQQELQAAQGNELVHTHRTVSGITIKSEDKLPSSPVSPRVAKKKSVKEKSIEHESIDKLLHPNSISGNISLVGGLAFTGREGRMEIFIERYGQAFEKGKIYLNEGRYIISPEDINGYLVAELRSQEGHLIGRGTLSLFEFPQSMKGQAHLEGINIVVEPVNKGARVVLASAYGQVGSKSSLEGAYVLMSSINRRLAKEEGSSFADTSISKGSQLIYDYGAKGHWNSIQLASSSHLSKLTLYPQAMVKAFLELVSKPKDLQKNMNLGVVFGEILAKGVPLSGAIVEMATASEEGIVRPIYFENELPILNRTATSRDGKFAFAGVRAGIHILRVTYKGNIYPGQLVVSENQKVSEVNLSLSSLQSAQVKIFDALTGGGVESYFKHTGSDAILQTNTHGEALLEHAYEGGVQVLKIDAGSDYPVYQTVYKGGTTGVSAPLLTMEEISKILVEAKATIQPDTGLVLGHVIGEDYFLVEEGRVIDSPKDVIFFNQKGQVVERALAGGGFIRINKTSGLENLAVIGKETQRVIAKIVVTDPDLVHVTTFEFK